jgi:hypothetical protein
MAVSEQTIAVRGLRDLTRAFAAADKTLQRDLRTRLRDAAEPVRADAQASAVREIRNVHDGDSWSRMRVGVTQRLVYVAPRERGSRGFSPKRRRKFGDLLMDRAMAPALERNRDEVLRELDDMLGNVGKAWERA